MEMRRRKDKKTQRHSGTGADRHRHRYLRSLTQHPTSVASERAFGCARAHENARSRTQRVRERS
eukprot:5726615-Alexandrium_andersonii.AAC.1